MAKKEESFKDKMKSFFSGRRDTSLSVDFESMKIEPYIIDTETLKNISKENPLIRLKHMRDLCDVVLAETLQSNAIEDIVYRTKDLTSAQYPVDVRRETFQFYCALIYGQKNQMHMMRSYFFKMVFMHNIPEDLFSRFDVLKALSDKGKNVNYFEYEIGPVVLNWFNSFLGTSHAMEYFQLVTNLVKYNAAYLDDCIVEKFVQNVLGVCSKTKNEEEIKGCLDVLEAILCYSHLPKSVLLPFMCSLCLTVNIQKFTQFSWKQMRNLLGTNIGHTGIAGLCSLLLDPVHYENVALIRGAIYFIGMALWSPTSVNTLIHPPGAVLPAFSKVLSCPHILVAYEVLLALLRLVKEGKDQIRHRSLIWDSLFDIVRKVLDTHDVYSGTPQMSVVAKSLDEFIDLAEESCPDDSREALYELIDKCSHARYEQSVIRLIKFRAENIQSHKPDFLINLNNLLEKFFKNEKRPLVQLELLKVINQLRSLNVRSNKEECLDQTILSNMAPVSSDSFVRKSVVELLVSMALTCTTSSTFYDILEHIKKILCQMLDKLSSPSFVIEENTNQFCDVISAVEGLANVFKKKLFFLASDHCIEVFSLLMEHLEGHYRHLSFAPEATLARKRILEFIFEIRANRHKQIGIISEDQVYFSVYTLCQSGSVEASSPVGSPPSSPSSPSPTIAYLDFNRGYQAVIRCLKVEKDWGVLESVLRKLPLLLWNKTLILECQCSIVSLATTLCHMITDTSYGFPESLRNAKPGLTRTDVQCHIYPCLAALTSYHSKIPPHVQRVMIRCLQCGLVSRSAKVCIEGLTLCILEMRTSMVKLLPDVLLKLSKISATKGVALPVLEFLSSLIRLPYLYGSFVEDQYMSIFAMALPYTNPFKFHQYTVALAHHVLSMWFLKCRIPFRREFANFIIKGLRGNLNVPKEREARTPEGSPESNLTKSIVDLHVELLEIGLDLMSRFTFGMCTNVPQRCAIAEFLLVKGQKSSWVMGNKIVTVTTSGCGTKAFKNGLCKKCFTSSHDTEEAVTGTDPSEEDRETSFLAGRKRHQSAIQPPTSPSSNQDTRKTKDDLAVRYQDPPHNRRQSTYVPDTDRFKSITPESASDGEEAKVCSCWCTNWAEVHIRRPTGNTSWMMKRQNRLLLPAPPDVPLSVLHSLTLPYREKMMDDDPFLDTEGGLLLDPVCEGAIEISRKPSVPIRRTNSSPDMGAGWMGPTSDETPPDTDQEGKMLKLDLAPSSSNKGRSSSVQPLNSAPVHMHHGGVVEQSFRDRGYTISVMSPVRPPGSSGEQDPEANHRSGMSPNFVFLQLFHNSIFCQQSPKPLLIPQTEANNRSLTVLDHIPPYDTHKIGVIYVGPGQADSEVSILSNETGSARYVLFLRGLGRIISLADTDPNTTYLGGLDTKGSDGKNALVWHDDVMQVVFHVSTLLLNRDSDKMRHEKKKHIANDCVCIVFNESGQDFKTDTIKGHVTNACIIITPEDLDSNVVTVKHKTPELSAVFGHAEPCIVSDASLPIFVRQLALHANLASLLIDRRHQSAKYTQVSNWIERLRAIKRLRGKQEDELRTRKEENSDLKGSCDADDFDSFTDYV